MKNQEKAIIVMLFVMIFGVPASFADSKPSKLQAKIEKTFKNYKRKSKKLDNGCYKFSFSRAWWHVDRMPLSTEANEARIAERNNYIEFFRNKPEVIYLRYNADTESLNANWLNYTYHLYYVPRGEKLNDLFPSQTVDINEMNKKGSGYIYSDERHKIQGWYYTRIEGETRFFWIDGINWSGDVKDGKLDGQGEGFFEKENKLYFVKGQFNEGKPIGSCTFYCRSNMTPNFDLEISPYNGNLAQISINGETDYIDNSFNVVNVKNVLANHSFMMNKIPRISEPTLVSGNEDGTLTAKTTFYSASDYSNQAILLDSLKIEYIMDREKGFLGLSDNGKKSVADYLDKAASGVAQLTKVFNTAEVSTPITKLKNKYHVDIQQIKYQLETIKQLKDCFNETNVLLNENKSIEQKFDIVTDLIEIYEVLDRDHVQDLMNRSLHGEFGPDPYNDVVINNILGPANQLKEMTDRATQKLNGLMRNPLFPTKNKAVAQAIKSKFATVNAAYTKNYAKAKENIIERNQNVLKYRRDINNRVNSSNIPKVTNRRVEYEDHRTCIYYSFEGNTYAHAYKEFKNGEYRYLVYIHNTEYYYTNEFDAKCAAYFGKVYGKVRETGRIR